MSVTTNQVVYPVLRYNDVDAAVAWLERVFQFQRQMVVGESVVGSFAMVDVGGGVVMLSSTPAADLRLASPRGLNATTVAVHVYVPDVAAHCRRATAQGAEIVRPLQDTEHGTRDYNARDLEGHIWAFSTFRP